MRSRFLFLALVILILTPPLTTLQVKCSGSSGAIISNLADLPAARELEQYLKSKGYYVEIKSPGAFWSLVSADVNPIFILGGPDAYEGVGEITRQFLTQEEMDRLRTWRGFGNLYIRILDGLQIVILAGNTRNETFEMVNTFKKIDILQEIFRKEAKRQVNPFLQRKGPVLVMRYTWQFRDETFHLAISIPESLINYYREKDHDIPPEDWYILASDPLDDIVISTLIRQLRDLASEAGYASRGDLLQFVIRFVQALPYSHDVATTGYDEYPRFPIETLADAGGDCEDTSILMATLLMELGYDVVLFLIPGHVGVGVEFENGSGFYVEHEGKRYYYLETTGYGWNIGELPPPLRIFSIAQFQVLHPIHVPISLPVISRVIMVSIEAEKGLIVNAIVVIENMGSKEAIVDISAGFKGAGILVIHSKNTGNFTVMPGEACTISISLKWPEVIRHRWIVVRLLSEGRKVDEIFANF